MKKNPLSRRGFLKGAATAAAFTIVPRHVLGGPGYPPPSEKLNIAAVGVGGRGANDLDALASENIVALCDVDFHHAGRSAKRFPDAKRYDDFRVMLDKERGIDAVMVATPDHVHFHASLAAIERGKHVYCEKPLTHSVWEARTLAAAARKAGVATQMGNQGQAGEGTRRLREVLATGIIGPVHEVHQWTDRPLGWWPQGIDRPRETPKVPDHIKWDLWLGPAPARAYNPIYHPFRWRGWWDFGTGALGDIGCHALDPIFRALDLGAPESVEAASTKIFPDTYPLGSLVTYRFPAREGQPPLRLSWYDGGLKPPHPPQVDRNRVLGKGGVLYIGEKGVILDGEIWPLKLRETFEEPPKTLPRSPGHHREWIDACKGGRKAGSNFDFAGPLTEAVLLGNIALRAGKALTWNADDMTIPNARDAEKWLKRDYREGWEK